MANDNKHWPKLVLLENLIDLPTQITPGMAYSYNNTRGQQQSKMVSKISRSQDFIEISGFLWDFNIS